ncbi:Lysophospholipase [Serinicoccus hydrothermalis]|uniref:Lysophospholipase n=1 Tax=Serinicoccus hydrothermalis TaxID=1758689 RepID=A0A1B1NBV0_9MICO|nr:Lysophospholipase [Serinicoccus hydrothermalis]
MLGAPFEQLTLALGVDGLHGPLVATLVRRLPEPAPDPLLPDVDVLYVHGWSDYFFQTELADFWTGLGARFFALDLRRYGRSLRPEQAPGFVESLDDYDADIAAALDTIAADAPGPRRIVLLGHSTGGLTLTLWAARHPGRCAAVVLNSPWLELQVGRVGRRAVAPLLGLRARNDPRQTGLSLDLGHYTQAQRVIGSLPPAHLPAEWRPERGFAPRLAWGSAILDGHQRIARGQVDLDCPVLVLLSTRSTSPFTWSAATTAADSVLTVEEIAYAATRVGHYVTLARVAHAVHDVFLSLPTPRAQAYAVLRRWTLAHLGHSPTEECRLTPTGC